MKSTRENSPEVSRRAERFQVPPTTDEEVKQGLIVGERSREREGGERRMGKGSGNEPGETTLIEGGRSGRLKRVLQTRKNTGHMTKWGYRLVPSPPFSKNKRTTLFVSETRLVYFS